ncbi:MAG: ABC transporter permease subunit [Oscillochloridaceae bacterium]|nr:ABC transporter permease subunit [Chloroflexaceae bacterium]MDW8392248.1 ABC transporter permease subunit [Oscillochloridaceae bacterium]
MLRNLFAAEWLKLRKRPLAWVLLAAFLALLTLNLGLWALVIALQEGALSGGRVRVEVLNPAQTAQIERQLSFPGVFGAVLGQMNSVGGILAVILAAGALGSDFGWGTLRAQLIRSPARGLYLLAKLLALLLALVCGILAGLAVGCLIAAAASAALGLSSSLGGRDLLALGVGIPRSLYVILPYVLATFVCAALGRSALAGAGGGLVFLALDVGAGSLSSLGLVSDAVRFVVNLMLQPNINRLVVENAALFGLDPTVLASGLDLATLPSLTQATLVVAAYCALFGYGAWRLLARRDITGAG